MRKTLEAERWVVYLVTNGEHAGIRCVCTENEWREIRSLHPGTNLLVEGGITSESEAEKLARGTSGETKKRDRRQSTR